MAFMIPFGSKVARNLIVVDSSSLLASKNLQEAKIFEYSPFTDMKSADDFAMICSHFISKLFVSQNWINFQEVKENHNMELK